MCTPPLTAKRWDVRLASSASSTLESFPSIEDEEKEQFGLEDVVVEQGEDDGEESVSICSYYQYTTDMILDALEKAIVGNEKQFISLKNEQRKAEECEDIQYKANLILSNLWQIESGATKVTVIDWEKETEIELILDTDSYNSPSDEADALFARARRMKRGTSVVKELIVKNEKAKSILLNLKNEMLVLLNRIDESDRIHVAFTESEEITLLSIWQRLFDSAKKTGIRLKKEPFTIEQYEDIRDSLENMQSKNKWKSFYMETTYS